MEPSALELALERSLEEGWKEPAVRGHPFFVHWAKAFRMEGEVSAAAVADQCRVSVKPMAGLLRITGIVGQLDWPSPHGVSKAHQGVVEIVELMTLVFCERRVRDDALDDTSFTLEGMLRLPTSSQLAASLVAAVWLNRRVKLALDDTGQLQAVNILSDLAPTEFGFKSPKEACAAEVATYLHHAVGGVAGAHRDHRAHALQAMKRNGVPADQDILDMLEEFRADGGVDPVFGIPEDAPSAVGNDVFCWVGKSFGIASFTYGLAATRQEDEAFIRLQGTLLQQIDGILKKIHAGKAGESLSVSGKASMTPRTKLFISYAHTDKRRWLGKIQDKLAVLETEGLLDVWDDTRIKPGSDWEKEIENALKESRIALLLISDGFLKSRFIRDKEFSVLLERQQAEGLRLYPLLLEHCVWEANESLKRLQIKMADRFRPLEECTRPECSKVLTEVARDIIAELKGASGGGI